MYHITCDGLPLMDWRDNDLVLVNPKVKLEVNTVGEGSFTIYKNHPYYDKLKKLKSVFEVTDENGVIFRGRATGDTVDFDHGMFVDLEGAMAYFNDSIVRSFNYPDDFLEDADYIAAANNGNVVAFFLGWLIDNHNAQVQDFQKMKLGNVTVTDPNNYLSRSSSEYASTWEVLKAKLFDSSLGGYLCIRYEDDGNYIDYLAEFTETNSQEIAFGENLLDLKSETEASETYSAIIPIGVIGLTIEGLADKDLTDDLVKVGDTIYSRQAVEQYGWIYAPTSETTWEDVTDDSNLLKKGANWLLNRGSLLNAMEATAVDLHFTDKQVESLRIYRNVNVHSSPHGISETLPLAKLEIDLLNPQNTKITVGKTLMSLTERNANLQEEAKKQYSKLSKTDEQIRLEVQDELNNLSSEVDIALQEIMLAVNGKIDGEDANTLISAAVGKLALSVSSKNGSTSFVLTDGTAELSAQTLDLSVDAVNITGKLTASQIDASELKVDAANITGSLVIGQLPDGVATTDDLPSNLSDLTNDAGFITDADIPTKTSDLTNDSGFTSLSSVASYISNQGYQNASGVVSIINGTVTADFINALGVTASYLQGNVISIGYGYNTFGYLYPGTNSEDTTALTMTGVNGLRFHSGGNIFLRSSGGQQLILGNGTCQLSGGPLVIGPGSYGSLSDRPSSGTWGQVYFALE